MSRECSPGFRLMAASTSRSPARTQSDHDGSDCLAGGRRGRIGLSESFAGVDSGADSVAWRGQRTLPLGAVPAGRVVEEVQVNDYGARPAAEIGALGGVEGITAAAVAGVARCPVSQRQKQPSGVLLP